MGATAAKPKSSYRELIDRLVDARPWGYSRESDLTLEADDLGAIVADTDDTDVMEQVMRDEHFKADLADTVNSNYSGSIEEALGCIALQYISNYAQGRVFEDVRAEVRRREDAEEAAAELRRESAEDLHGMRSEDFA